MIWAGKTCNWDFLVKEIQAEIDSKVGQIPSEHIAWIQHYLDHDEYSMAFEYLLLEIMEREDAKLAMDPKRAIEMATFLSCTNLVNV